MNVGEVYGRDIHHRFSLVCDGTRYCNEDNYKDCSVDLTDKIKFFQPTENLNV